MVKKLTRESLFSHPANIWALGFGSGLAPKAPGTFGTLAAIPIYLLMVWLLPPIAYVLLTIVLAVVGVWICGAAADNLGVHDHPGIVWDEIVGYLVTMFAAPLGWKWVLVGFVLFRIFDIWKPWPIKWLDRHVDGGLGIMLDDIVAGFFALACMQLLVVVWL